MIIITITITTTTTTTISTCTTISTTTTTTANRNINLTWQYSGERRLPDPKSISFMASVVGSDDHQVYGDDNKGIDQNYHEEDHDDGFSHL